MSGGVAADCFLPGHVSEVVCKASRSFLPCQVHNKSLDSHGNLLQDFLLSIFCYMIFRHHAVGLNKSVFASIKWVRFMYFWMNDSIDKENRK